MKSVIIDVREPEEFQKGHVKGARNLPPHQLMNDLNALEDVPKDTEIVVYCLSGSRSAVAIGILQQRGYTNLTNGINQQYVEKHFLR